MYNDNGYYTLINIGDASLVLNILGGDRIINVFVAAVVV